MISKARNEIKAVKLNFKYLVSRSIVHIMSNINEENERSNNSRQINYWSFNYPNGIKLVRLWFAMNVLASTLMKYNKSEGDK